MLKFSSVRGRKNGVGYYKNYEERSCHLSAVTEILQTHSISAYIYGEGSTDKGEKCFGHRAARSIESAGNVLILDLDNHIDSSELQQLLTSAGVAASAVPSKSWKPELQKWHVLCEFAQDLPMDKMEFKDLWLAAVQWLKLESYADTSMSSQAQQIAPSFRTDHAFYIDGEVIDNAAVLAKYTPPPAVVEGGKGIEDYLDSETVFTLSGSEKKLTRDLMVQRVKREGKQRTHCLRGIEHGNTKDTAFVSITEGGEVFYHCSGQRCSDQGSLGLEPPFEGMEEADYEVVEATPEADLDLWSWPSEALRIIQQSPVFRYTLLEEASVADKEAAVAFACNYMLRKLGARLVDDGICIFTGTQWDDVFREPALFIRWIGAVCTALPVPFAVMSNSDARTKAIYSMVKKSVQSIHLKHNLNILNLRNCMIHIGKDTVKDLPHHPSMLFKHTLPYEYDPAAQAPVWLKVVDRVMCGRPELIDALQQACGYLLLRDTQYEKMIGFVGEGENGKSTVMRVLKHLVGRQGYSAEPIKGLLKDSSEGQYSRAQLAGKLINITNELTPSSLQADSFKDLISGEDITARHIYGKPFTLAVVPKQLVAMNTTDRLVQERSHGFMRRLHLIPFDYRLKDEHKDSKINDKLEKELAGILNWCIEGAQKVVKAGKLGKSTQMTDLLEEVERDGNPVLRFVEEYITLLDDEAEDSFDNVVKCQDLYHSYRDYCHGQGALPLGERNLIKEMKRLGVPFVNKSVRVHGVTKKVSGAKCRLETTGLAYAFG